MTTAPYKFKTKPYQHQVRALKKLLNSGWGGALLMEPRTGKTKTTVDWMSVLAYKRKARKAVVFCPSRVMGVWDDQIAMHSPLRVHVTLWDKDERKQGNLPKDDGRFDLYVVVVNYDAFGTPGRKLASGRRSKASGRFKTRATLMRWIGNEPCIGVLDESHRIKSPSGKASNMIVSMGHLFEYRAILTGTPITKAKRSHDIYMQWRFLNPQRFRDLPTIAEFKERYSRWVHVNGYPQWLGPSKHYDELVARVHADSFAVKRADCFDLPAPVPRIVPIKLKPGTARVYDEMAAEMVARLKSGDVVEASIALVQSLRLMQISAGIAKTDDDKLVRIGREKIDALKEIYEEWFEHEEKLVVCGRFKADLNAAVRLAAEMDVPSWQLRGGVSRSDSDRFIREFRNHDGPGVFVMQPAAGAMGIDLSTASGMVWYTLTSSWVDYSQAMDRIALNPKQTQQIYLLADGVDRTLYDTLQGDGEVGKAILDNPERLLRG